ncbi:glycosyltransferase family 2 protein [Lutibacter sp. TH_r2]|uniref:glycosyltransferase family 2 protein n=1 Tax=Lutibacter sp. TH_r2 TaxID=3082083 RepID=UPI00295317E6|nr:glycosyltransferase family 2 protein [Lutibacter sp. TH_r2]MDV7187115.1 glycosyltransferase family 2 protein [Lutibacter sp. TH_r2]
MDISVVIVNYNVQYFLEQCILSVQAASKNCITEIIVVDNNSKDGSCEMLQKKYPSVILIANKNNTGFSKANNQGVEIATGKYVLILNPDTVLAEDTFDKLLLFAKKRSNIGIIGVKLVDGTGKFLPESKRGIPTPRVSFNKLFGVSSKQTGKYYATHINENETGVVDVLVGAFMFIKKVVYIEVKGFDEDYFMYGEDIDLSYKVKVKGYQNYYLADTQVIHYKGESTKKDIKYLKYFLGAMKIFYKKHFRLNLLYDFTMSLGIQIWYLMKFLKFRFYNEEKPLEAKNLLLFTENKHIINSLKEKYLVITKSLAENIEQVKSIISNEKIDKVVFDNDEISNKKIICSLQELKNQNVAFKIHPRTTNYIIGSTCSEKRGEVEFVKTN